MGRLFKKALLEGSQISLRRDYGTSQWIHNMMDERRNLGQWPLCLSELNFEVYIGLGSTSDSGHVISIAYDFSLLIPIRG